MKPIRSCSLSVLTLVLIAGLFASFGCSGKPSDSQLVTNVQKKIAADAALQGQPITVAAKDGTVTLSGAVAAPESRSQAASDAASVSGVKTVVNDLAVGDSAVQAASASAAPANADGPNTDTPLAESVKKKIAEDSALNGQRISVSASGGTVTLSGAVSNSATRELASRDASGVDGVKTVVNNLTVGRAATPNTRNYATNNLAPPPQPAPAPAAAPVAPPAPPAPLVVPAGTPVRVTLGQTLSSNQSQSGQSFSGTLASPIRVGGQTVFPTGSRVQGTVTNAKGLGRIKGEAELALRLDSLSTGGQTYPILTSSISRVEKGKGKRSAIMTGGGAGLGALIGGLTGGGKGAAIGALVGGGGGAAGGAFTGNKNIVLPAETVLTFDLQQSVTVRQ